MSKRFAGAANLKAPPKSALPRRKILWSKKELLVLGNMFPHESIQSLIEAFPIRTWNSIQAKARKLGLHRPDSVPLSTTLKGGDIGFCAGMIIADGRS